MSSNNQPAPAQAPAKQPVDLLTLPNMEVSLETSHGFAIAQRIANMLANSTLVPKEYQGNLSNCIIALNMAYRMKADPLMIIQNLYIVYGRPGWSSQFLIATFNKSGKFSALRYEFVGTRGQDDWGCFAYATELATGEVLKGTTVTMGTSKAEGWFERKDTKWKTIPEQMLRYRAASWFVRAYAPEIAMGLQTAEELRDTVDLEHDGDAFTLPPKGQTSADLNAMLHPFQSQVEPVDLPPTTSPTTTPAQAPAPQAQASQPEPPAQEQAHQPPILQPEGNGKKRPTAQELDDMRADMVMELNEKGVNLKEIEKEVGEFSNRWMPKHVEKIRGEILPRLLGE